MPELTPTPRRWQSQVLPSQSGMVTCVTSPEACVFSRAALAQLVVSRSPLVLNAQLITRLVGKGHGRHVWEISPDDLLMFPLPGTLATIFGMTAMAWSKTSFALTLLNVVKTPEKWFLWVSTIILNLATAGKHTSVL